MSFANITHHLNCTIVCLKHFLPAYLLLEKGDEAKFHLEKP